MVSITHYSIFLVTKIFIISGTIVFLNNLCVRDEKLDHNCIEFARARELYLAARDQGIRVLIYGSMNGFDLQNELIPALNDKLQIIHFKVSCCFHLFFYSTKILFAELK